MKRSFNGEIFLDQKLRVYYVTRRRGDCWEVMCEANGFRMRLPGYILAQRVIETNKFIEKHMEGDMPRGLVAPQGDALIGMDYKGNNNQRYVVRRRDELNHTKRNMWVVESEYGIERVVSETYIRRRIRIGRPVSYGAHLSRSGGITK